MDDLNRSEEIRIEIGPYGKLDELRQQIDKIDKELLDLFETRMERVREVADYKSANNLKILDESREKKVLENTKKLKNVRLQEHASDFLKALMDISKDVQTDYMAKNEATLDTTQDTTRKTTKNTAQDRYTIEGKENNTKREAAIQAENLLGKNKGCTVGFQGLPGSYSEQAVREHFGVNSTNVNYVGFEDVFKALQAKEIDYGVLPLENSFTGGIAEVYDLLCRYGFYIIGERCVQVDHNLLAPRGARLEDISKVYSHPQAFLQCSKYLNTHPEWSLVAWSNTAVSAKLVADSASLSQATIASRRASMLYGLSILAENINNNTDNFTRFIIIGRNPESSQENNKISIAVAIAHEPGSLYRILSHFAKNGLNMLKIESRPIVNKTWEYLFYIDFEGNLEKQEVRKAVKEIQQDSFSFRLLGNYRIDR